MILNNFKTLLISALTTALPTITLINGTSFSYTATPALGAISSGGEAYQYAGGNTTSTSTSTSSNYIGYRYYSLAFGSGSTDPTADDYQMESPYDTTNHFSWKTVAQSHVLSAYTKTLTASISNINEEDLIISEIGLVAAPGATDCNIILIARSLITPVTIAYGETKTFQYTLDISNLNDSAGA